MIALLLGIAPYLPFLLQMIGTLMSAFGASKEELAIYQDMVEKQNAAGDLSVISHDRHLAHIAAIEARIKARSALKN